MSPVALAVRHLAFEDLGLLDPLLRDRGYDVRYLDVAAEGIDAGALGGADLLVVLGGPVGVNDTDRYPVLNDEISALRARLSTRAPTIGICLGAQLLARVLGAEVVPGATTEIGYATLDLTPDGLNSPLRHLDGIPVLHWHNDCLELPAGARNLASTAQCRNQAFVVENHILGLQFHLETDDRDLEHWLWGHAGALAAANIDPRNLRRDAAAIGPELARRAAAVMTQWLDEAGR